MADKPSIQHWVAIAGRVTDQQTGQPIVGAELTLIEGPPLFQQTVAVRQQDPQWAHSKVRLNHTLSRAGGLFYFLDLPEGGPYKLTVTVPHQSARYGKQTHEQGIDVAPKPDSAANQVVYQWVDVALISTGVTGTVTTADAAPKPVVRATVTLQDAQTVTDANGRFALYGLTGLRSAARVAPPKPRLTVTAPGFTPVTTAVDLAPGAVKHDLEIILNKA